MIPIKDYVDIEKVGLKRMIEDFRKNRIIHKRPSLLVVQLGSDSASNAYIRGKEKDCNELGIEFIHYHFTEEQCQGLESKKISKAVRRLKYLEDTDGVIIQLPVPEQFDISVLQEAIDKNDDVDGFLKDSIFKPCTPKGIMDYLSFNNVDLNGKVCTIIGRSKIVGQPLANMMIEAGATVISCNSKTPDVRKMIEQADIVVSAIGRANHFDKSYFKENQIVIDVGINRDENGKLCGDVQKDVAEVVTYLSPVPGGVGLLTRLALMENVVDAWMKNYLRLEKDDDCWGEVDD